MDLSFTPEEQAFASEAREWLIANLGEVPTFATFDDEIFLPAVGQRARSLPWARFLEDPAAGQAKS